MMSGKRQLRKTGEAGFSLLEMIVVVAIFVILVAIAAPSFTRALRRYQLETSARNVANMIQRARYEAIRANRNVTVIAGGGAPTMYGIDFNGNNNLDPGEPRLPFSTPVRMMPGGSGQPALATMGPNYAGAQIPNALTISMSLRGTSMRRVTAGGQNYFVEANAVYILYLQHQSDNSWAAVTVTPGGRVRVWFFGATTWTT